MQPAVFAVTVVPLIAAYDGFFGPGTGSFYMMGFVLLAGYGVLKATAHTKLLNFRLERRIAGGLCLFRCDLVGGRAGHGGGAGGGRCLGRKGGDAGRRAGDPAFAGRHLVLRWRCG